MAIRHLVLFLIIVNMTRTEKTKGPCPLPYKKSDNLSQIISEDRLNLILIVPTKNEDNPLFRHHNASVKQSRKMQGKTIFLEFSSKLETQKCENFIGVPTLAATKEYYNYAYQMQTETNEGCSLSSTYYHTKIWFWKLQKGIIMWSCSEESANNESSDEVFMYFHLRKAGELFITPYVPIREFLNFSALEYHRMYDYQNADDSCADICNKNTNSTIKMASSPSSPNIVTKTACRFCYVYYVIAGIVFIAFLIYVLKNWIGIGKPTNMVSSLKF